MRPVSGNFLTAIRGSHKIFSRVRVLTAYQEGVAPTGTAIDIVEGTMRSDAKSDVRSSIDVTTRGDRRWPAGTSALLTPYGNEMFVERGIDYGNGTVELVSLGYFRIDNVDQDTGLDGAIRLSGRDRMVGLIDGRLTTPREFTSGTSISDVFDDLVHDIYPDATILFDFDAGSAQFEATHVAEEDRYRFLNDIAVSRGKIMYWDYKGQLRIEDPPDPTASVYTINSGQDGVLVELSRELTRDGVYNAVVANGQAPGTMLPVTAVVYDNNVASPTYWEGRFGKVPRYYYSPFITTTDGARSAAQSILQQSLGLPFNINLTTVPNPALEPFDPITISHRDGSGIHIIDSMTIPLTAGTAQSIGTRMRINLEPGEEIL